MIEGVQISDSGTSMILIVQLLYISKLQEEFTAKASETWSDSDTVSTYLKHSERNLLSI